MPLFFFFSGFCLKTEYFGLPWKFAWKRVKGIYWPYLKWCVVFLLLHNMMFRINLYSAEYGYKGNGSQLYSQNDFFERFRSIVFLMQGHEQLLGGYWFMRALFFGSLIAFVLLWLLNIANKKTKTPRAYPIVIGGGHFACILRCTQFLPSHIALYYKPTTYARRSVLSHWSCLPPT